MNFDNASSVYFNNKEVNSIVCLDNNKTWYQKQLTPLSQTVNYTFVFQNVLQQIRSGEVQVVIFIHDIETSPVSSVEEYQSASVNFIQDYSSLLPLFIIDSSNIDTGQITGNQGDIMNIQRQGLLGLVMNMDRNKYFNYPILAAKIFLNTGEVINATQYTINETQINILI